MNWDALGSVALYPVLVALLLLVWAVLGLVRGVRWLRRFVLWLLPPRRVRVPQDGEPLNDEERAAELLAMRGWADHAGTAALAWPEQQIEAELREGAE